MSYNILERYMKEHFPCLILESPLFYQASIGIRFELGVQYDSVDQATYLANVQLRTLMLFNEMFDEDSNIIMVINNYRSVEPYFELSQGDDVFPKYIKNKNLLDKIDCNETKMYDEETMDLCGINHQYVLICNKKDIDYGGIFKAKSLMDFALKPYISDEVFFINTDKHVIFYMYNDYGLDIVSEEKRILIDIYEKYNDWILDYDRPRIDSIFKSL